jgi:fumarylacetoacetase
MRNSWVPVPAGSGFGLGHLPYGVAVLGDDARLLHARIGDHALDLEEAAATGLFDQLAAGVDPAGVSAEELRTVLDAGVLNPLLAAGPAVWAAVRARTTELLTDPAYRRRVILRPVERLHLVLPWEVGDYTDFYSSEYHAANVGRMFRPSAPPLYPNWKHMPVAYHGRSSTVVVSGTDVVRPCGQFTVDGTPRYGPSSRLDLEAEVGFVVGVGSALGTRLSTADFRRHVFGVVLLDDWSARDLQAWETVPLGPFTGKSFATSVSAWVTPLAALESARVPGPEQDPPVLDYLRDAEPSGLDLTLGVSWNGQVVSRPSFATMYWSPAQQLAHLTVNGARVVSGDLYASGTVSSPDQWGSLLEIGAVELPDGTRRQFLADGDEVVVTATARGSGGELITLGEVCGRILPPRP